MQTDLLTKVKAFRRFEWKVVSYRRTKIFFREAKGLGGSRKMAQDNRSMYRFCADHVAEQFSHF